MPRGVARLSAADLQRHPHLARRVGVAAVPVKPVKKAEKKKTEREILHDRAGYGALIAGAWMLSLVFAVAFVELV